MCIYGVFVCAHVHANAQNVCALVCREQKPTLGVFLCHFSPYFWGMVLQFIYWLEWLVSKLWGSSRSCYHYTCTTKTSFYRDANDPNSDFHACIVGTLQTETSPQHCYFGDKQFAVRTSVKYSILSVLSRWHHAVQKEAK